MNRWIGISIVALLLLLGSFLFPQAANSPVLIGANNLSDVASISSARTNLGVAPQYTTVTFSATPTFTATSAVISSWTITLTGNVTSSTLAAATTGQTVNFKICQDGTGGRTFAWPTGFGNAATISPVASVCTKQSFFWDGTAAISSGPATVDSGPGYSPEIAAPSGNPASGFQFPWFDSTDHTFKTKDSSGNVYIAPLAKAARTANQFVTNIPTTGIQAVAAIATADLPANGLIRSFGATFTNNGSALASGATVYATIPFACTITAWNITVSPADTATIDIWKIATGTAIPTVSNTITASATPAISTGTAVHSTTLTGWSTGVNVTANDIIGVNLKTVGGTATQATLNVQCNAT